MIAYIFQSTSVEDGSIIEWDSGDLKMFIKNERLVLHFASTLDEYNVVSKHRLKVSHEVIRSFIRSFIRNKYELIILSKCSLRKFVCSFNDPVPGRF